MEDFQRYPKIQTLFKRGEKNKLIEGDWTTPEIEYLASNLWTFTEKVDGTNTRIHWSGTRRRFGGREHNSSMPVLLFEVLDQMFCEDLLSTVFGEGSTDVTLFGEGYGPGINKRGAEYRSNHSFILFDVMIGGLWLERHNVEDIAKKLGIDVVPIIGRGTLGDAIGLVQEEFWSYICDAKTLKAEGIVARPAVDLLSRRGERLMTKIKTRDFK